MQFVDPSARRQELGDLLGYGVRLWPMMLDQAEVVLIMVALIDAVRTIATLKVRPGRLLDQFMFCVFAGGHELANCLVVLAYLLEFGGNGVLVRRDARFHSGQLIRHRILLPARESFTDAVQR